VVECNKKRGEEICQARICFSGISIAFADLSLISGFLSQQGASPLVSSLNEQK
jgi:hypothetical protein